MDANSIIGAIGDLLVLVAVFFAWRTLVTGNDATKHLDAVVGQLTEVTSQLERLGEQVAGTTRSLSATLAELERMRREDRLERLLEKYEHIAAGVQTVILAQPGAALLQRAPERIATIRAAQGPMRAMLATIPGATGALDGALPKCWNVAHGTPDQEGRLVMGSVELGGAEIEIGDAIRQLHEQLKKLGD